MSFAFSSWFFSRRLNTCCLMLEASSLVMVTGSLSKAVAVFRLPVNLTFETETTEKKVVSSGNGRVGVLVLVFLKGRVGAFGSLPAPFGCSLPPEQSWSVAHGCRRVFMFIWLPIIDDTVVCNTALYDIIPARTGSSYFMVLLLLLLHKAYILGLPITLSSTRSVVQCEWQKV